MDSKVLTSIQKDGIAIIGAGLGGIALALALHGKSIPCRIYEAKGADTDVLSSGLVLTPNGCRVLDELGILSRLDAKSYIFEDSIMKDSEGRTITQRRVASAESSVYPCYRLYRLALLQEMKKALSERNIPIFYNSKFEKITSDMSEGIVFEVGGKAESAAMVIGSDGIHSTLWRHITDVVPAYSGILCVYGHIPTASVQWPDEDFMKSCTILGKQGSLFMVPEVKDKSDLMVGTQFPYPEADRKGWEALAVNKDLLSTLLRKDYYQWNETMRHIIDELCKRPENLLSWPFYAMPKLKSWASTSGRVIMIGDAAHAMPASSGQGVNQALEDAFSIARTLSHAGTMSNWPLVLSAWQAWRQEKIDKILQLT